MKKKSDVLWIVVTFVAMIVLATLVVADARAFNRRTDKSERQQRQAAQQQVERIFTAIARFWVDTGIILCSWTISFSLQANGRLSVNLGRRSVEPANRSTLLNGMVHI